MKKYKTPLERYKEKKRKKLEKYHGKATPTKKSR